MGGCSLRSGCIGAPLGQSGVPEVAAGWVPYFDVRPERSGAPRAAAGWGQYFDLLRVQCIAGIAAIAAPALNVDQTVAVACPLRPLIVGTVGTALRATDALPLGYVPRATLLTAAMVAGALWAPCAQPLGAGRLCQSRRRVQRRSRVRRRRSRVRRRSIYLRGLTTCLSFPIRGGARLSSVGRLARENDASVLSSYVPFLTSAQLRRSHTRASLHASTTRGATQRSTRRAPGRAAATRVVPPGAFVRACRSDAADSAFSGHIRPSLWACR